MSSFSYLSHNKEDTLELGRRLAKYLNEGDVICLFGDLGSGKTTFVKGVASGLKIKKENVHSPTFVLMNVYEGKHLLFHFDFYRMNDLNDIASLGYEEFLYGEGVSIIEWAEKMGGLLPEEHLRFEFCHKAEDTRSIKAKAKGKRYKELLKKINTK